MPFPSKAAESFRRSPDVHASLARARRLAVHPRPDPGRRAAIPFERSLTVGAAPALEVSTGSGDVTVRAGAGGTIVVKGTVSVSKGSDVPANAAEIAKQVAANPPITRPAMPSRSDTITDETTRKAVSISYEISVPAATGSRPIPGRATSR